MTISPSMLKKKTFKKTFRNRVLLPFSFVYLPCSISFCLYPPEQAGRSRILLNFTLKTVVCAWKNHDPPSGPTCWGWNTSIMIHNLHYRIIKCSGLEEIFKRYLVQCLFSEKGHLQLPRESHPIWPSVIPGMGHLPLLCSYVSPPSLLQCTHTTSTTFAECFSDITTAIPDITENIYAQFKLHCRSIH